MQDHDSSTREPNRRHPDWESHAPADEIDRVEQVGIDQLFKLAELFDSAELKQQAEDRAQLLDECRRRDFAASYPAPPRATPTTTTARSGPALRSGDQVYDASLFFAMLPAARRLQRRHRRRAHPLGHAPRTGSNARRRGSRRTTSTRAGPDDDSGGEPEPPGPADGSNGAGGKL